jgi:hypothetical protein
MYFFSVAFLRASTTCAMDGILFPMDLRGMKGQMISKEGDSDSKKNFISSIDSTNHLTC